MTTNSRSPWWQDMTAAVWIASLLGLAAGIFYAMHPVEARGPATFALLLSMTVLGSILCDRLVSRWLGRHLGR